MSDQDPMPDPIDQAYARAEAALSDEAARAARRARVLAAVAQETPLPSPANLPPVRTRRANWRWAGFATAASVAGLAIVVTRQAYLGTSVPQAPPPAPAASPAPPVTSAAPVAAPTPPPPRTSQRLRSAAVPEAGPAPPPALDIPSPPPPQPLPAPPITVGGGRGGGRGGAAAAAPIPTPAPPPPELAASAPASNIPGVKAVGSPVQRVSREDLLKSGATDIRSALQTLPLIQTAGGVGDSGGIGGVVRGDKTGQGFGESAGAQTADIGGQGSRATIVLLDGQRLANSGVNTSLTDVSQAPAPPPSGRAPGFNIPAGDASSSLAAWSAASGVRIDAPDSLLRGVRTAAVQGSLDPRDALNKMIAGTRLQIVMDDGSQISLGSAAGDTVAQVNATAIGTNISGVKAVGSPVQRASREDLLKTGATDIRSALQTLPPIQTPDTISPANEEQAARLRAAAAAGRTSEVVGLLNQGALIDRPDAQGNTALMLAIQANHPEVVDLLRRRGARLDVVNKAGQRASDLARTLNSAAMNQALGLAP